LEKKNKCNKKKQRKVEKKKGKLEKKWKMQKKKKKRNALWITVVIHSDFGCGEQWFPHTI
jgi:hypothetical protein